MKKCRYTQEELEHFVYFRAEPPRKLPEQAENPPAIPTSPKHLLLTISLLSLLFAGLSAVFRLATLGLNWFDLVYFLCYIGLMIAGLVAVGRIKSAEIRIHANASLLLFSLLLTFCGYVLFRVILPYYQIPEWGWLLALIGLIEIICAIALIRSRLTSDWYGRKKKSPVPTVGVCGAVGGALLSRALFRYNENVAFAFLAMIVVFLFFICVPVFTVTFARLYYYYRYLKKSEKED